MWAPDYVTLAELKSYLRINDSDDDADIALAITAASRAVDTHCGRQFGLVAAAEERIYPAQWDRRRSRWVVEIDDLMTTTGLTFETSAGAIDAYELHPRNAAAKNRPWTYLVVSPSSGVLPSTPGEDVASMGRWGWSTTPSTVKLGSRLQASRFFARRNSPYGIAGSPDDGSEMRLLAKVDPDVALMLTSFKRWWAAA